MEEGKKIREELREQQAERLLASQGSVPGWKLPAGYLDRMTEQVLAVADAPPLRVVERHWWNLRYVAAAAVVVLALGFWYIYPAEQQPASTPTIASWEDIPTEDLQDYVTNNLDEFELELLAAYASASDEDDLPLPGHSISTEALEEYLEADDWLLEAEITDTFEENL